MHQAVSVQPGKETAWKRAVGQQQAFEGIMNPETTGVPDSAQIGVKVYNGPQTPLAAQGGLTLMIPLLFWCNKDPQIPICA
jgi:hypothetical protein